MNVQQHADGRISLIVRDAPLNAVLELIAQQHGLSLVSAENVTSRISVTLSDVPLETALTSLLSVAGHTWTRQDGVILVTRLDGGTRVTHEVQGRQLQVFTLNYVAAADVERVVRGLLSPVGQVFTSQISPLDQRRTQEQVVVEDLPAYVARAAEYVAQVDQPPRQVCVEAHILQVSLKDSLQHGVDFEYLTRLAGASVAFQTLGFTNPSASPGVFFRIDGEQVKPLVELLQETTDSKTLASPRLLVLNGQEAQIQIGASFGYFVTTTTQTSTLQNVNFLDVGVVLKVKATISDDGQVLMSAKPKVSDGRINEKTGLPEETTTQVETTLLLPDGCGMVIGGLIKEADIEDQSKLPLLGDLWLAGRLFQRRNVAQERSEIIIVLVPRVVPYSPDDQAREQMAVERATTPLLQGSLERVPRPWEAQLPDAMSKPRRLRARRLPDMIPNLGESRPHQPDYYFPTTTE